MEKFFEYAVVFGCGILYFLLLALFAFLLEEWQKHSAARWQAEREMHARSNIVGGVRNYSREVLEETARRLRRCRRRAAVARVGNLLLRKK